MSTDDPYLPDDPKPSAPEGADGRFGRFKTGQDGRIRDRLLDCCVALRSSADADDLHDQARFYARLRHPGLPCILDFVRDDAGAALVMAPVNGMTLAVAVRARATGQSLSAIADATACTLTFIAICDALSAAHLRGVVHGAISPDVIMLGDDGQVVIDGWSKAMLAVQRPLTMRFVSHTPVPVELATDDLHHDIRGLGVCLFTALTGLVLPGTDEGQKAALDDAAASHLPRPLLATIRKALRSDASTGYASVAALRADLVQVLAGHDAHSHAPASSLRQHTRTLAAIALLVCVVAGAIAAFSWRSVSTYSTWGSPLIDEDFSSESWKSRWQSRGQWQHRDGVITSASEYDCALILNQRLTPPVAIEYTGRFTAQQQGDLSIWWCESDAFALRPGEDIDNARAWYVQAGAYSNSWCTIWQTPARLRTQVNSLILKPDRDYRFRVEIDVDRLAMWIDGEKVLEHHEIFPISSGTIALYTWDPGKSFDDVRIWQKPVPALVSPLTLGDEALRSGRFDDAVTAYARVAASHQGEPLGDQALYFQGVALHRQGSPSKANKVWKELPDGILSQQAACLGIDDLIAQGDVGTAASRFATLWRDYPAVHNVLRQRWQICGQAMRRSYRGDPGALDQWIALRDATFPSDQASRWLVAEMFNVLNRWDETIQRFPDEYRAVAHAMLAIGRNAEVLAADWSLPLERTRARMNLGEIETALNSPDIDLTNRIDLLCKTGRAAEAAKLAPYPAQLYLGGLDALLAQNALGASANAALIAAGRLDEAAGAGVQGSPQSGKDPLALVLLGRLDEAEHLKADTRLPRLLHLLAQNQYPEAREQLAAAKHLPIRHHGCYNAWFGPSLGRALIDKTLGDTAALRTAVEDGTGKANGWGGRYALVCAAALDPAKDAAVSAMQWRSEAKAWLLIAQALRGELADDPVAALTAWRAFKALPMVERLIGEGHIPSPDIEVIADWRITVLGQSPR